MLNFTLFSSICKEWFQGRRNRGGSGGREMPFSARQFVIAFASKQCNTQTTNRETRCGRKRWPKSLWKSTNSDEQCIKESDEIRVLRGVCAFRSFVCAFVSVTYRSNSSVIIVFFECLEFCPPNRSPDCTPALVPLRR